MALNSVISCWICFDGQISVLYVLTEYCPSVTVAPSTISYFTLKLIVGCQLCLCQFPSVVFCTSPSLAELSEPLKSLFSDRASPLYVLFLPASHSHSVNLCFVSLTINKTSQSWQINLLVNGMQPRGTHSQGSRLSLCFPSDWKASVGIPLWPRLSGVCDIQNSVAQTPQVNFQCSRTCSLQINTASGSGQPMMIKGQ